jgi:hypothetical protein
VRALNLNKWHLHDRKETNSFLLCQPPFWRDSTNVIYFATPRIFIPGLTGLDSWSCRVSHFLLKIKSFAVNRAELKVLLQERNIYIRCSQH